MMGREINQPTLVYQDHHHKEGQASEGESLNAQKN